MSRRSPDRVTAAPPVPAITTDADGTPLGPESDPHAPPPEPPADDAAPKRAKKPATEKE